MRPPEFWRADAKGRDAGYALRALLTPVSWAYEWAAAQRIRATTPRHAPVPVICVGNFTLGGAGKTPVTRALRRKLGPNAHTLSRGYGGRLEGPLRVTPDMDAREVGDEPLLHAADGPAWIARDRVAGALAAAQAGAHVVIMDDGFQNPELGKDLSLVVVDAEFGIGNRQVFPAGPLRERLSDGLSRADAIILLGESEDDAHTDWLADFRKPVLRARIEATEAPPAGPLVAFAGLGRPEKFFDTLADIGGDIEEAVPFDDHHVFGEQDFALLDAIAEERSARLITTEKDFVRLPADWRAKVLTLPIEARFEEEPALDALLAPIAARMG